MDINKLILEKITKKQFVRVADIVKATGFSRAYVNRFFRDLKKERRIVLIGRANKARYVLASRAREAVKNILSVNKILKNKNLSEDVVLKAIKDGSGIFIGLPRVVVNVVDYAFTEMLNNAIEHSRSKEITVTIAKDGNKIRFGVADRGVGVFKNIMLKRGLNSEMEAIQDLLKGKQTTDAEKHSGEGIFFTSKIADRFSLKGSGKSVIFDNIVNDIFIKDAAEKRGTRVNFEIAANSKKELNDIFKAYAGRAFEFSKTSVRVDLFAIDNAFISRSQARRILAGLEKFKEIVLDFRNVETAGQGFADEIFRVWLKNHPDKKIQYQNANDNILFIIKRAKEGARA